MTRTLDELAAACHRILVADAGPDGLWPLVTG